MKVLVYGAGVIGSYLCHVLCQAGCEVTLLARGRWKEVLSKQGLRIFHHLQRKETLDHPRIIEGISEAEAYDVVFAVMPYHQMPSILKDLSAVRSPLVVLVGNNMAPLSMQQRILDHSPCEKQVLFGFQATAGKRDFENGRLICERLGKGSMDLGGLHSLPYERTRKLLSQCFSGTGYTLHFQPDMEAYLICHLAAILPIGYLTYACKGTLLPSTGGQRRYMRLASREAYGMLKAQGIPILPEGDEKYYSPGLRGVLMQLIYFLMAKTTMGDLIACAHCRNAYEEMQLLDEAFTKIMAKTPDYPLPHWRALKEQMPSWECVRASYKTPT